MAMTYNGVPYRQLWLPQSKYGIKAPYAMTPKKLTLHETDNEMAAINEATYHNNNNNQTSFHGVVDDVEYIQMIPYNRNAWHSGDGGNGYGNRNTVALEIAQNFDRRRQTTALLEPLASKYQQGVANAIRVGAQILIDINAEANNDNIRTHHDWNGKWCPRKMLNDGKLLVVKAGIINEYNRIKGKPIAKPVTPSKAKKEDGHLTLSQVVDKAIAGGYGNYPERVKAINDKTNYTYDVVQPEINKRFDVKTPVKPQSKPTAEQVANDIAFTKHKWGNNPGRARMLRAEGYNPTWVQNRVNELLASKKQPSSNPSVASGTLKVGSKVILLASASRYATGQPIPSSIKNKVYTIQQIGTRDGKAQVLLREIQSWVWQSDVRLQGSATVQKSTSVSVGQTIRVNALYSNINSTKNVRVSPISGYVAATNSGGRNPIKLLNKRNGYVIGYTRANAIV